MNSVPTSPEVLRTNPLSKITDWYLPENESEIQQGFIYPSAINVDSSQITMQMAQKILAACKKKDYKQRKDFSIRVDGLSYRGHYIEHGVSGSSFAIRKSADKIQNLLDLNINEKYVNVLMHERLHSLGGLVIICGGTGQGKSTTCASVLKERMMRFKSFCYTIEDPPELPLNGVHGGGRCIQTELQSSDGWGEASREAMRCYPSESGSILFVGETRDKKGAAELLRIANNGHLVFTTMHANGIEEAVGRLKSLASDEVGSNEASLLMASSLRLVVHQKLKESTGIDHKKHVLMNLLSSSGSTSAVGNKLKRGEVNFNSEISHQAIVLEKDRSGNGLFS